jgi:hypothetical protein
MGLPPKCDLAQERSGLAKVAIFWQPDLTGIAASPSGEALMPANLTVSAISARPDRRQWLAGAITFLASGPAAAAPPLAAAAADVALIMVEDDSCVYCVRWHAEVGQAYAKSAEGRFAPLERHRLRDPEIAFLRNVRYTPTFVLVRGDTEIGRITGYPGAELFWEQLAGLMAAAGFKQPPAAAPADDIKT